MLNSLTDALGYFFFFNDTATTEIYTLSLHDALPISRRARVRAARLCGRAGPDRLPGLPAQEDRKSTRLNSSHPSISYAVFCLKKKKKLIEELYQGRIAGLPYHHVVQ